MKKLLLLLLAALLFQNFVQAQIKISEMPTFSGDASEAYVPIVISGANRKTLGKNLSYAKVDSVSVSGYSIYWHSGGVAHLAGTLAGGGTDSTGATLYFAGWGLQLSEAYFSVDSSLVASYAYAKHLRDSLGAVKQNIIQTGDTTQYIRGDLSLGDFATAVDSAAASLGLMHYTDTVYLSQRIDAIAESGSIGLTFNNGLVQIGSEVHALYNDAMWNANKIQSYYVDATAPTSSSVLGYDSATGNIKWKSIAQVVSEIITTGGSGGDTLTVDVGLTFKNGLTRIGNEVHALYLSPIWDANRIQTYYVEQDQPHNGEFLGFDSSYGVIRWMRPDSITGSGGGSTPNLQQVTDVGNITTNNLLVNGSAGAELRNTPGGFDYGDYKLQVSGNSLLLGHTDGVDFSFGTPADSSSRGGGNVFYDIATGRLRQKDQLGNYHTIAWLEEGSGGGGGGGSASGFQATLDAGNTLTRENNIWAKQGNTIYMRSGDDSTGAGRASTLILGNQESYLGNNSYTGQLSSGVRSISMEGFGNVQANLFARNDSLSQVMEINVYPDAIRYQKGYGGNVTYFQSSARVQDTLATLWDVRNASGSGGGSDTNFGISNITFTGNRSHQLNGYSLEVKNGTVGATSYDQFLFESGSTFLKNHYNTTHYTEYSATAGSGSAGIDIALQDGSAYTGISMRGPYINLQSNEIQIQGKLSIIGGFLSDSISNKVLYYNTTNGSVTYGNPSGGGGGGTPGIDAVLAVGQALTQNRTINSNSHTLTVSTTGNDPALRVTSTGGVAFEGVGSTGWVGVRGTTTGSYSHGVDGITDQSDGTVGVYGLGNTGVYADGSFAALWLNATGTFSMVSPSQAKVLIGNSANTGTQALVELESDSKAFLLMRMTAAQASAITAVDGMMLYVTDTNGTFTSVGFWGRQNGAWAKL